MKQIIQRQEGNWISTAKLDLIWMFSIFWIIPFFLIINSFFESSSFPAFFIFMALTLGIVHSYGPIYTVLFSDLFKDERKSEPKRYVHIPIYIIFACVGLGVGIVYLQDAMSSYQFTMNQWILITYIVIFYFGHFWHFGKQDFGVLSLYRMRSKQFDDKYRVADRFYTIVMMYFIQPIIFLYVLKANIFTKTVNDIAPFFSVNSEFFAQVTLAFAFILSTIMIIRELIDEKFSLPKMLYYIICFSHPFLLFGSSEIGQVPVFVISYLWHHWIISIFLMGRINIRAINFKMVSKRHFPIFLMILSIWTIFIYFHREYFLFSAAADLQGILTKKVEIPLFLLAFFYAYGLGEQLLHFYTEKCLFQFRNKNIREKLAKLI